MSRVGVRVLAGRVGGRLKFLLLIVGLLIAGGAGGCGGRAQPAATPEGRALRLGERIYNNYCLTCHQANGQGIAGVYPPLRQTEWVLGDRGRLIRLVLNGVQGPIEVKGETYDNVMTPHGFLSDEQVAAVLTYVRQHFGNTAGAVTPEEVAAVRAANTRTEPWTAADLQDAMGIPGAPAEAQADTALAEP